MSKREEIQKLFTEWQKARIAARKYNNEINLIRVTALPFTTSDSPFWLYVCRGRINLRDHKLDVLQTKLVQAEDRITIKGLKLNICLKETGTTDALFQGKRYALEFNYSRSSIPIFRPYDKGLRRIDR